MSGQRIAHPIDPAVAASVLLGPRIAVVGASEGPGNFGRTICRALRDGGVEAVPVHPTAAKVDGERCYPTLDDVPGPVDAVVVVVAAPTSVDVVRDCARLGVGKVWLFQGLGGPGAASEEAVRTAEALGLEVVPGACPLMFLDPVGWFHRIHRAGRRATGSIRSEAVAR